MSDAAAPNAALLQSLGRLVRGLSALFWGLPIALVVCVQTAKGDWLRPFGVVPPLLATAILCYGLNLLGHFQKQERVWRTALDRCRVIALLNLGLSPFLFWWSQLPSDPFYRAVIITMIFSGLFFLLSLNPLLCRLTAMLPDETMRTETKLFTSLNRYLVIITVIFLAGYLVLRRLKNLPQYFIKFEYLIENSGMGNLLGLFLVLLPLAMTMALVWKIKEVIFASVFSAEN